MSKLPADPYILLSFLNMKLRDFYPGLDALCDDLALDRDGIVEKMRRLGYAYAPQQNQFIPLEHH